MTGQVDEAGREQRWRDAAFGPASRNGQAIPVEPSPQIDAVVARLMAEADRENARLAGQVAAIRALCDEAVETAAQEGIPDFAAVVEVFEVRAALVASSPTTPKGPT